MYGASIGAGEDKGGHEEFFIFHPSAFILWVYIHLIHSSLLFNKKKERKKALKIFI
jgi:hypothetical protein